MKLKLCILTLAGWAALGSAAFSQTNPPAGETSPATTSDNATKDAAQPDSTAKEAPAAEATLLAANAPAADATAQPAAGTATPPVADAAAPSDASQTNPPPQAGGIIPLIVMDDVPLTDAIKNLARQAALNYMLDPGVSFGQVGPDGKAMPQPTVSIRWENVSAEQALTALLNNYELQLTEDPKSKIARVTKRDPAAPPALVTKVIQLKFSGTTNMMLAIQNSLTDKRSKVVPDTRTSQLVLLATEKELVEVDQLIERLDTQTKQVLIEGRLLETSINPSTVKGVDWSGTLANQHVVMGNNGLMRAIGGTPGNPIENTTPSPVPGGLLTDPTVLMNLAKGSLFNPSMAFLNADGVAATISFLNTYAETKVISSPRTVTLDNEMSIIEVGTMFPIVNTTAGTPNTPGGSQVTYSNLTVRLEVTPRISANNYVNLKVSPRIMRLGDLVKSTIGGFPNSVNSFEKREIQTSVMIPSGDTLVMGGLIQDNVHQENQKVPLLGDIPGIGFLFRHDFKNRTKSNLIVFLTPTIIQDEDFQPTKTDYLKTPVPTSDSIEGDWSAWDSGKAKDWSKPAPKGSGDSSKFSSVPTQ